MQTSPDPSRLSFLKTIIHQKTFIPLLVSIVAALIYLLLSTVHLGAQGLYYDELFQAASSFAYIGHPTHQFAVFELRNVPIMNLAYVGAIKTAIYGLFLRFLGHSFSVTSWRMVGIIFSTMGIFSFGIITRKKLSFSGILLVFFLLITDITVILTSRFDWGPVAISFFLRLLIIAIWIDGELSKENRLSNSFWLGILFGISLFEKLSAAVLFFPLLFMLVFSKKWRTLPSYLYLLIGGIIGSLPLIFSNLISKLRFGYYISLRLQNVLQPNSRSLADFFWVFKEYLSLGSGTQAEVFILGYHHVFLKYVESILMAALLVFAVLVIAVNVRKLSHYFRISAIMLLSYFSIILSLYFLPSPTWIHHWVIATPFQYIAIVFLILGLFEQGVSRYLKYSRYVFIVCVGLIMISRIVGVIYLEQSFIRGDSGNKWDPSLTAIGEFASAQSDHAIFIAGDWGVANQMICFLNGKSGVVYEYLNLDNHSIDQILQLLHTTQRPDVYLVFPKPPYFTTPEARDLLLQDISSLPGHPWQNQPLDALVQGLKSVEVYKFSKIAP